MQKSLPCALQPRFAVSHETRKPESIFSKPSARSTFAGSGMIVSSAFDCAFTIQAPDISMKIGGSMHRAPGPNLFIGNSPSLI
jgi:hypothetical protein